MPSSATRTKVPDGQLIFAAVHPDGMAAFSSKESRASSPATEADEKAFWQKTLSSLFSSSKGGLTSYGNLYKALPSVDDRSKLKKVSAEELIDWAEKPDFVFDKEWLKELMDHTVKVAEACETPISVKGLGVALRALAPGGGGTNLRFECAIVFDDVDMPAWHEWKEVPPHAFKPGKKVALSEQVKQVMAKKESKEVQWKTYRMRGSASSGKKGEKA